MSVSRDYVVEYIHDACIELRKMAADARFEVLTQILGMAVLEAMDHQRDRQQSCPICQRRSDQADSGIGVEAPRAPLRLVDSTRSDPQI
jgi:hypothetical protein